METQREALLPNMGITITGCGVSNWVFLLLAQAQPSDQDHAHHKAQTVKESCFGAAVTMNQRRNGAIGKMESGRISAWITNATAR